MLNIVNPSNDPAFNLALEEYVLTTDRFGEDCLIIWQNVPTVVIGRHQNVFSEINHKYVQDYCINVVRRLSGGGAVYHDLGNVNFSFIKRQTPLGKANYSLLVEPVLQALRGLGVDARYSGRNDLMIGDKKISGNAQYYFQNSVLHHGTLLYKTDFSILESCLSACNSKYTTRGVKSVQSRVANVAEYLPAALSVEEFKKVLVASIFRFIGADYFEYSLNDGDRRRVETLAEKRYRSWAWNFGLPPRFNRKNERKFAGGTIALFLDIDHHGSIRSCKIHGDFFAVNDISELEEAFIGKRYDHDDLAAVVERLRPSENYFVNISDEEFMSCFF